MEESTLEWIKAFDRGTIEVLLVFSVAAVLGMGALVISIIRRSVGIHVSLVHSLDERCRRIEIYLAKSFGFDPTE